LLAPCFCRPRLARGRLPRLLRVEAPAPPSGRCARWNSTEAAEFATERPLSERRGVWAERRAARDLRTDRREMNPRQHRERDVANASNGDREFAKATQEERMLCGEIRKLSRQRRWQEALHLLAEKPDSGPFVISAVLDACTKALQQQAAWQLFEDMPVKTAPAFNSMITMQGWLRRAQAAEQLLDRMRQSSIEPDYVTYTAMITVYGAVQEPEKALGVLDVMKAEGQPISLVTYGAAMSACARAGDKEKTWGLFEAMQEVNLAPELNHFNSLIVSCSRSRDEAKALEALALLRSRGLAPDNIMYTALVGCIPVEEPFHQLAVGKAEGILKDMKASAVAPDAHAYNAVLRVAASVGDAGRFDGVLAEMGSGGFQPNQGTALVQAELLQKVRQLEDQRFLRQDGAGGALPPAAPTLPHGWASAVEPTSGQSYYWKVDDPAGTTTWQFPSLL